ncbi:hypothetical protein AAFF_G00268060 [Aldrovandia affinis]|uniref:Uncharacterized protein n=1 Tax=Aldrovandia affinis TaxID=143900 RepID=A0AAD7SRZ2_9TELE|nr:hypothetical protein AAFF_G00268060 [Aldrovandia affinis]
MSTLGRDGDYSLRDVPSVGMRRRSLGYVLKLVSETMRFYMLHEPLSMPDKRGPSALAYGTEEVSRAAQSNTAVAVRLPASNKDVKVKHNCAATLMYGWGFRRRGEKINPSPFLSNVPTIFS